MINKIIYSILGILLAVSIAGNIFFILGKGINIDKSTHTNVNNHNENFQGQLMMNLWMSQGDTIEWVIVYTTTENPQKELVDLLKPLPPQISYFATIIWMGDRYQIIYPNIMKKQ